MGGRERGVPSRDSTSRYSVVAIHRMCSIQDTHDNCRRSYEAEAPGI